MTISKNKLITLCIGLSIALSASYFIYEHSQNEGVKNDNKPNVTDATEDVNSKEKQSSIKSNTFRYLADKNKMQSIDNNVLNKKPIDKSIIEDWQIEQGFHNDVTIQTYKNYHEDTLTELVMQGDIVAMHEIALAAQSDRENRLAQQILDQAAARGSIKALFLSAMHATFLKNKYDHGNLTNQELAHIYNDIDINGDISRQLSLKTLSYYTAAAIRGHVSLAAISIDLYVEELGSPITIEEEGEIAFSANVIYEEISRQREQLGFDAFDNSYPEEYARAYNLPLENNLLSELSDLTRQE